ncbi:MAG: hypothetical protein AB8B96_05835 [Lysobacterales bacterium]
MKPSIAAIALLTFSLSNASAQSDNEKPEGRRPPPPHHQLEALGLTQTQEQEVHLILQSHREEMRALRTDGATCEDQQVLQVETDDALAVVMSEEQLSTFKEQKPRGKGRGRRDNPCAQASSR